MNGKMSLAALAAAIGVVGTAQAGDMTLTFQGFGANQSVGVFFGGAGFAADDNSAQSFTTLNHVGEYTWTNEFGADVTTFCVQIFEGVGDVGNEICFETVGLTEVPESPPQPGNMSATQAGLMQDMYSRFIDPNSGSVADTSALGGYSDDVAAAAFALMVWEISHENVSDDSLAAGLADLDITVGAFRGDVSGDLASAVSDIIDALGDGGFISNENLFGLTNDDWQDQIMIIPVPTPVLLAGIGLVGAAALRRRMR